MAAIRIYPDENVPVGVVEGLRRRGVDAWSTADAGNLGLGDEAQLCYAAQERAILFTHDVDLVSIAQRWTMKSGTPLAMLMTNLRNSGYLGKNIYKSDRRLRLTAKGDKRAREILRQLAGPRETD